MKTMDKETAHAIGQKALALLVAGLASEGLEVRYRGGSYDTSEGTYSPRFVISLTEVDGKPAEQARFERAAVLMGLPTDAYHRTFEYGLDTYRLSGLTPKAVRFPVLAQKMGGKSKTHVGPTFKLPFRAVEHMRVPMRLSEAVAAETRGGKQRARP